MKLKTVNTLLALATLGTIHFHISTTFAQGSLTPPAGAPAPVMKSLSQVEPRTPISTTPFTISQPGSYYLTTNLFGSGLNHGINIAANDVVLDLNGFAITGPAVVYAGVFVSGSFTNVTVRNGTIKGWVDGVRIFGDAAKNIALDHLNISDTFGYGIDSRQATITACSVTGSGNAGIYAVNSRILNCKVDSSRSIGIELRGSDLIDSRVNHSAQNGVYINYGGCQIIGNTFWANNTTNGASYSSIRINDNNNRIENNHISYSGVAGSGIGGGSGYSGNIIIRNSVTGSGAAYAILGSQIVGPIINTSGTITSVNPWANFAY